MIDDSRLISIVGQTFYSPDVYRRSRSWRGSVIRYLAIVLCILWIPGLFQIHQFLRANIQHFKTEVLPQLPVMYFDAGKIKTPENRPYLIRWAVEPPIYQAIIDTSGQYMSLSDTKTFLLITHDTAVIRIPEMDTFTFDLSKSWFKPKVIDQTFLIRLCQGLQTWIFVLFCIALFFLSFLKRLIEAIFLAGIGFSATSALRLNFRVRELFSLAVVAMTPAMIFETVVGVFSFHNRLLALFWCLLLIGYFVFAIISGKSNVSNNSNSEWDKSERMVFALPVTLTIMLVPVYLILFLIGLPRWGALNYQAQYAGGIRVMDVLSRVITKLMFPWIVPIGYIILGIGCLLIFVHYVVRAVNWRSRKAVLYFFLSQTSLGAIGYFLAKSLEWPLINFYSSLHSWYGEEYWLGFVLPPLLALLSFFLVVTTWACWGYVVGDTETSSESKRLRLHRSYLATGALLIFYGGLRIGFLCYGDNGKSFAETTGLDERTVPIRTVVIVDDSAKNSNRITPLQIKLTAEWLAGIPRPGEPQTFYASLDNLKLIENWLANHPRSLYSGVAYSALATGYLAQWDVESAYQWLHRYPQSTFGRMMDVGVLDVGPLKPERKTALDEWTDKSKWILGPVSKAKLVGQFMRYGDLEKAEQLRREVLVSNDADARNKLAQFMPSSKTISNGVIRGIWNSSTLRPMRIGLFRMSTTDGQHIKGAPLISLLGQTRMSEFVNLIDSSNLKEDGRWEFKYLREGEYAVGFLFDSQNLPAGKCVQIIKNPIQLNLSKQQPLLDLGRIQIKPCRE